MTREFHFHLPANTTFFHDLNTKGKIATISGDLIEDYGFDLFEPKGFKLPNNFPECCPYHQSLKTSLDKWFNDFPNCCKQHKQLNKRNWFDKNKYNHLVDKIQNQVLYTEFVFSEVINSENWYDKFTHYVEYNKEAFGLSGVGYDVYFNNIEHIVRNIKPIEFEFSAHKRQKLIEYIEIEKTLTKENEKNRDLNILNSLFQKWIKAFPNLPYFSGFKEQFTDKVPMNLFLKNSVKNMYSGMVVSQSITKSELVEYLIQLTKDLLKQVNTEDLVKSGSIGEKEKYKIDLIFEKKLIIQNKLLNDFNKKEIKYLKVIKKWLQNEINCFKELNT